MEILQIQNQHQKVVYDNILLEQFDQNSLNYKCDDSTPSRNPFYCSLEDKETQLYSCSAAFAQKMTCDDLVQSNNCYLKYKLKNGNCKTPQENIEGEYFGQDSACFQFSPNDV